MCKSGGKGKSGGIAKRCEQGGERRGGTAAATPAVRRNKHGQILCIHNRRLYICVDCGGGGICAHKRQRHSCSMCKSGGKGKSGGIAKR
jgi:hypothetical protein